MAVKLSTDTSIYFVNFATGNDFTPSTYVTYANDLDDNFLAIRTSLNQAIDEINALSGTNAVLVMHVVEADDPDATPPKPGVVNEGVLGQHSYFVQVGSPTSEVDVAPGAALLASAGRVVSTITVALPGSGGAGTRWIAIDVNGVPSLETLAGQQALDIASITWDGAAFTAGTEVQLAEILLDGDDYILSRRRPANGGWAAKITTAAAFRAVADRFQAIERALTGFSTDAAGDAVSNIGFAGNVTTPGLIPTDGSSTRDTGTGFFRQALNSIGLAIATNERFRFADGGLTIFEGTAGAPSIAPFAASDRGINFASSLVAVAFGGANVIEVTTASARFAAGASSSLPGIAIIGDPDNGFFSPGANRLQKVGNSGVVAAEWTAEGHVDHPNQPRFRFENATESLATSAALSAIDFADADAITEVDSTWFDEGTSTTDFNVPTGADGFYLFTLKVTFDETGTGAFSLQRSIAIEVGGSDFGLVTVEATSASPTTSLATAVALQVSAATVVRARVRQNSGDTMNITDIEFAGIKLA